MRVLNYAVALVALASNNGRTPASAHTCCTQGAPMRASQQGGPEIPVDVALVKRWAELFASVIERFQLERRDLVGNIEGDFTTREIRVRATSAGDNDSLWVSKTFSEAELRAADVHKTARELYDAALRKSRER